MFKFLDQIEEPRSPLKFLRFSAQAQEVADYWRQNLELRLAKGEAYLNFESAFE